jgi:indolepyruvate ferredoxin oxidoreductase beta subunit
MAEARPIKVLIAALGGEGGGVLSSWMHKAAIASGHFVQGTFIPGVAQRTGSTTYYLEVVPGGGASHSSGGTRPVLALNAAPGEVDLMVASELLEATRAIQAGYVSPDRTLLIASTARVFTVDEKAAMADGRLDAERMLEVARRFARRTLIADLSAAAEQAAAPLSAVLLGAIAGSGILPIATDAFRAAIASEGKAVAANLRGFEAGLALAERSSASAPQTTPVAYAADGGQAKDGPPVVAPRTDAADPLLAFPAAAHAVLRQGIERLTDYQDAAYARLYLDQVRRFVGRPGADPALIRELSRHLAVRMSVEDVIRVAQLKLREARVVRVTREAKAGSGDIVDITEYMKPGPEEILGLLPPGLGRWALGRVAARGWENRSWPIKVRTTRLSGHLRLAFLASLRRWRPRTLRFAEEEAWIARWLGLIERALPADAAAAREIVATASLVRGYSDTYKRGLANWIRIAGEVIEPMLDRRLPLAHFADAVLQARLAATKDPEGEALAQTIAAIGRAATPDRLAAE